MTAARGPWQLVCIVVTALAGCGQRSASHDAPTSEPSIKGHSTPRLVLREPTSDAPGRFEVEGLSPDELSAIGRLSDNDRSALFAVFVGGKSADLPPMLGEVVLDGATLRFTPRFSIEPGIHYRAVLHRARLSACGNEGSDDLTAEFELPKPPAKTPTVVTHVYPGADQLPENQLRFYVHFSAPMSRGQAYQHVHLFRSDGQEVTSAFLELGEELWDREQRRFTLFCDPGRVKRELKPREELGPVLVRGTSYTLVIDRDWPDANGNPLADDFRKNFDVLPPDEVPIDVRTWQVDAPPAGTTEPLVVRFPEPLDRALLERVLWITGSGGQKVAGAIEIDKRETVWRFTPQTPWVAGDYLLVAETTLEDLAGNAIGRTFEVDEFRPIQRHIENDTVTVPFKVASPASP